MSAREHGPTGTRAPEQFPRRAWTREQIRTLEREYATTLTEDLAARLGRSLGATYAAAKKLGLEKHPNFVASVARERMHPGHASTAFRYGKGHVPANKGLRRPGYAPGRMAETQFQKGQRTHNYMPVGACRYSKEGYLQQKVYDTGYPPDDWVAVHHLLYEEVTGKRVPKGKRLVFRDGDKENILFENLEVVTPAEMMRRNSIHHLPAELKEVILLRGAINRRINRRLRAKEQAL